MRHSRYIGPAALLLGALIFSACEPVEPNRAASSPSAATTGKIPVTTSSEEARKEFLAGRNLSEKLQITDSIAHYDKAISLDPQQPYAYNNRGSAKLAKGDLDGALEDITKSLTLDSENAEAYCNLGLVQLAQHKEAESTESFEKCYQRDNKLKARFDKLTLQIKRTSGK